jgi:hypothetical protein
MRDRSQSPSQEAGRVVRFRPRGAAPSGWRWPLPRGSRGETPVRDLAKYERSQDEDDYRHRMTMNALALVVTTILIAIGIWLATTIADLRTKQDCYLRGGPNCNQLLITKDDR